MNRPLSASIVSALLCLWSAGHVPAAGPGSPAVQPAPRQADQVQRQLSARGTLTATQVKRVNRAVAADKREQLGEIGRLLAADPHSKVAQRQWQSLVRGSRARQPADVDALVKWVLRDSYRQASSELRTRADKVKRLNEQRKRIRAEIKRAREHLARYSRKGESALSVAFKPDGRLSGRPVGKAIRDSGSLRAYIEKLEEMLGSASRDGQLANVDLQNQLQKQQQTLQMLANVSKMLHDTAMAIIRKLN